MASRRAFLAWGGVALGGVLAHHKPSHRRGTTTSTTTATTSTTLPATTTTEPMPTATTVTMHTNRSGLPWRSGVRTGGFEEDTVAFEAWRGRLCDVSFHYTDRTSWANVDAPWPLGRPYPGEFFLAHPFYPEGLGITFDDVIAGTHDAHFQTLGTNIVASGRPNLLVSLAWEMNGTWMDWSMGANPDKYAACYRRVVDQVHVTAPGVRFAWVINARSPDPTAAYPGNAYVHAVGIDSYDQFPKATTEGQWTTQRDADYSMEWIASFARSHGKRLLIQEWGMSGPASADKGGDNPFWVTKMQDWFRANADLIWAECYFDSVGSTNSQIFSPGDPVVNPNSATEYKAGLHG